MNHFKIIASYVIAGPILGGLIVTLATLIASPNWLRDPVDLLVAAVVFAFPLGGIAAFSAGVTHALLAGRVQSSTLIVVAVALAGIVAQAVQMVPPDSLMRFVSSMDHWLIVAGPPVGSAVPISVFLLWRSARMSQRLATDPSPVDSA